MKSIQQEERSQSQRLKRNIKRLIHDQLHIINPWWLISFHYPDHHIKEDQLLDDVSDLKRKLHRIIYKSRDRSLKGAVLTSANDGVFSSGLVCAAAVHR